MYLTHVFTIDAAGKIWTRVFGVKYEIFIFVAILLSLLAGHAAYIFYEIFMTSYLDKTYRKHVLARESKAT